MLVFTPKNSVSKCFSVYSSSILNLTFDFKNFERRRVFTKATKNPDLDLEFFEGKANWVICF